ncbi:hypothetical protein JMJ35_009285 [Cladonia borealis]|uniref:Uncharacterized protein n=1 Tax=Cladonia borealis TaxID=184061 RepID=A0AA39QTM5_9LECA|nr:hypothetical protein JMJ35_009285 [Cladonia borealis]
MHLVSCGLRILYFIVTAVLGSSPLPMQWSNKSYGPDGPWQAVTIHIGQNPAGHVHSQLDAHPGGRHLGIPD